MPTIGYRCLAAALAVTLLAGAGAAAADTPPNLRRGVNITHWFRYPPSRDPAALRGYLDDAAIKQIKDAGFDFVRLPVQPALLDQLDVVTQAVARLERHGLSVIVSLHPVDWHLEIAPSDQARLLSAWRSLAEALRRSDPAMTVPEVLNEPVFAADPAAWASLQHRALLTIRGVLPANTIVLTGADWGSVRGLLALRPEPDRNVIYSFHLYEPAELTALGAYRPGLDTATMARLPFPVSDPAPCEAIALATADAPTAGLIRFYCAMRWDADKVSARIAEAAEWGRRNHVTVIVGEFGASERLNPAARLGWLATVRAACEQQRLGWALWGYDDSMGFSVSAPGTRALDPGLLGALGLEPRSVGK
jgi:endoglucanase